MSLTAFVDIAIGLTLMYLCASLLVTTVNEFVAQLLTWRGEHLATSLAQVIDDPKIKGALARVPTLAPLFGGGGKKPSYVDPQLFANALVAAIGVAQRGAATLGDVEKLIDELPESTMRAQLLALVRSASGGINGFIKDVGSWVDRSLTMLGGAYKAKVRVLSLFIGLAIAVLFNLDTLHVVPRLYRDADARAAIGAAGAQIVDKLAANDANNCLTNPGPNAADTCKAAHELALAVTSKGTALDALPIGWSGTLEGGGWAWATRLTGWIVTALAISLGAPFWFDFLSKLVSVRHGMDKPAAEAS